MIAYDATVHFGCGLHAGPGPTGSAAVRGEPAPSASEDGLTINLAIGTSMADAERALILATLRHHQHQKERTAAVLGISLKTLYNRLKEYAAQPPQPQNDVKATAPEAR